MPLMVDHGAGRIVTVYGNLGDDGREHVSAFAAAKAAIARFTETLATELEGSDVVAICIHPGFVRTPMTEHLAHSAEGTQWLPSFGEHADEHWGDGTAAVDLIHRIAAGRADRLSGRVIHVGDDLEALTETCRADPDERRPGSADEPSSPRLSTVAARITFQCCTVQALWNRQLDRYPGERRRSPSGIAILSGAAQNERRRTTAASSHAGSTFGASGACADKRKPTPDRSRWGARTSGRRRSF